MAASLRQDVKLTIFWDITLCGPLKSTSVSEEQHNCNFRVKNTKQESNIKQAPSLAYSLTLKMEATSSTETSADVQRATRIYIYSQQRKWR